MDYGNCSEHNALTSRGRVPLYEVFCMQKMLHDDLARKIRKNLLGSLIAVESKKTHESSASSMDFFS